MTIEVFHRTHIEGQGSDALSLALRSVCSYDHASSPEAPPLPTIDWDGWGGQPAAEHQRVQAMGWDVWSEPQQHRAALA